MFRMGEEVEEEEVVEEGEEGMSEDGGSHPTHRSGPRLQPYGESRSGQWEDDGEEGGSGRSWGHSGMGMMRGYRLSEDSPSQGLDSLMLPDHITRMNSAEVLYKPQRKDPKMIGRYLMGERLGEGSYGKVKEALDVVTLRRHAVKIMKTKKLQKLNHGQGPTNAKKEIKLLKTLKHKNVIELTEVIYNTIKHKIYVVMEYCMTNLEDLIKYAKRLPEWQVHGYFVQLTAGVAYIHSQGIIHHDIKPGNLLLTADHIVKLSDFGVAEILDRFQEGDTCFSSFGTPMFQSLEIANGAENFQGFKIDVWAMGVTLWHLALGTYPYEGDHIFNVYASISLGKLTTPLADIVATFGMTDEFEGMIAGMLDADITTRFSTDQIKRQPWFLMHHPRSTPEVAIPVESKIDMHKMSTVVEFLENQYARSCCESPVSRSFPDDSVGNLSAIPGTPPTLSNLASPQRTSSVSIVGARGAALSGNVAASTPPTLPSTPSQSGFKRLFSFFSPD